VALSPLLDLPHFRGHYFRGEDQLLKGLHYVPRVIITDKLRSYKAAKRTLLKNNKISNLDKIIKVNYAHTSLCLKYKKFNKGKVEMNKNNIKSAFRSFSLVITASLLQVTISHTSDIREFESKINYTTGSFKFVENRDGLYTLAKKPRLKNTQQENVLRYEKQLSSTNYENVLMKVIAGKDGRQRVQSPTAWPNSVHTQLSIIFQGEEYGGSGVLVGPHHVLTAAHCVYDWKNNLGWASSINIHPALNDKVAPFGSIKIAKAYTFLEWTQRGNPKYDMALLVLEKSIGLDTGWGGMISCSEASLKSLKVNITGYPADKGFKQLWTMKHKLERIAAEQLSYMIDTFGGQSGSPIWASIKGHPYIIGVHTQGGKNENFGVRLSSNKFKAYLAKWIEETYEIKPMYFTPIPPYTDLFSISTSSSQVSHTNTYSTLLLLSTNSGVVKKTPSTTQKVDQKKRNRPSSDPSMLPPSAKRAKPNTFEVSLKELAEKVNYIHGSIKDENKLAKDFLKKLCAANIITKKDIAKKLGISTNKLNCFLKNTNESPQIICKLKDALSQQYSEFYKAAKKAFKPNKK